MSEDDAKAKYCPHTSGFTGGFMGQESTFPGARCIASRCMAWRVISTVGASLPKGTDGYCGLAGPVA